MSQTTAENCWECGRLIRSPTDACPDCGASLVDDSGGTGPGGRHARGGRREKSAGVAVLLSVIVTGMGHVYLGKVARGLAWLFGALGFGFVIAATVPEGALFAAVVPVAAAVDAYVQADTVNRGR